MLRTAAASCVNKALSTYDYSTHSFCFNNSEPFKQGFQYSHDWLTDISRVPPVCKVQYCLVCERSRASVEDTGDMVSAL